MDTDILDLSVSRTIRLVMLRMAQEQRFPLEAKVHHHGRRRAHPKPSACLEEGFEDVLSVIVLPEKYRRRLRATHVQEWPNEEIRIFQNVESALRLVGALLAEHHEG